MCSNPTLIDHQTTVACRRCDQCLSSSKNDWVARAMAESATAGFSYLVTLTYADLPNGETPDGAVVFDFQHVRRFLDSLRTAYKRKFGERGDIGWICCGEMGSAKGRVHWHLVIFSKRDITDLSTFLFKGEESAFELDCRLDWGLWPHGFSHFLKPDQKGMAYILKYALKARYSAARSQGTKRYTKSESFAASYFRMSKAPPIGMRFLVEYFELLEVEKRLPVSLDVRVPDYSGFWFLKGNFREFAAQRVREINANYNKEFGRDAPEYAALIASLMLRDDEKTLEEIWYGETSTEEYERERERSEVHDLEQRLYSKQWAALSPFAKDEFITEQCKSLVPCDRCVKSAGFDRVCDYVRSTIDRVGHPYPDTDKFTDANNRIKQNGKFNPFCSKRSIPWTISQGNET